MNKITGILILGLLAILLVSGCTSSQYNDEAPINKAANVVQKGTGSVAQVEDNADAPTKPVETAPAEEELEEVKVYNFNEPVVVGDLEYTFKSYTLKEEIGKYLMTTFMGSEANGIYLIVEVEVKNVGKKAEYLTSSNIKIIDDQEREFETDSSAAIYLDMDPEFEDAKTLLFDKLNPGLTQKGYLVFDIPEDIKGVIQIVDNSFYATEVAWVSWAD
ncbi:MAG: DUF4352 domain-containing protein [Candidatus Diapherotrites archaeon]